MSRMTAMRRLSVLLMCMLIFSACTGSITTPAPTGSVSSGKQPPDRILPSYVRVENPTVVGDPNVIIPFQYIVMLDSERLSARARSDFDAFTVNLARSVGARQLRSMPSIDSFTAELSSDAVERLQRDPRIKLIEPDKIVRLNATQSDPSWTLDRIDQRDLPLDKSYTSRSDGEDINVYVIDTGIRATHDEFKGRVKGGFSSIGDDGSDFSDCNGHGTHVAGTVAGETYGVVKKASLYGVRVMDCDGFGSLSNVIAGIDWVNKNHRKPAVANMSLGTSASEALDTAVMRSMDLGIIYIAAAGNDGINACNISPARVNTVITVGATNIQDTRAEFSNYGSCVTLFAPGVRVKSAWSQSDTHIAALSGTSMASPHVAGVAALYLKENPSAKQAEVKAFLTEVASSGKLKDKGVGSPDLLLYSGAEPDPNASAIPDSSPCESCDYAQGQLSADDYGIQPAGSYHYSEAGTHLAYLLGPDNADFDLALYHWKDGHWTLAKFAAEGTAAEQITYEGRRGYYLWIVTSYQGSGDYEFYYYYP